MRTQDLFDFIKKRHDIYLAKEGRKPKPWTDDPILQQYKFCNVYRELDTQTIWLAKNWRDPNKDDEDLWFASLVFRFVNWHETAEELKYPVPWNKKRFVSVLQKRKDRNKKMYSGAYMISTHGVRQEKHIYLANSLSQIWKQRKHIRPREGEDLHEFHKRLMNCFDVGSFIAAQVVADIKYAPRYMRARDWYSFAASGPGSRRGLNRVCEEKVNEPWKEDEWKANLDYLKVEIDELLEETEMPVIHAQDLQNCLCEFDKYERVRLKEGTPKSRYKGVE